MFRAERRGIPGTALASEPSVTPRTSSRFDAGSVLTSSTRRPRSASATAEAHARDVFPTPPLPVKNRNRVGDSKKQARDRLLEASFIGPFASAAALARAGFLPLGFLGPTAGVRLGSRAAQTRARPSLSQPPDGLLR